MKPDTVTISAELAQAVVKLVHERWGEALRNRDKDEPYWRGLQLQAEGVRTALIERAQREQHTQETRTLQTQRQGEENPQAVQVPAGDAAARWPYCPGKRV